MGSMEDGDGLGFGSSVLIDRPYVGTEVGRTDNCELGCGKYAIVGLIDDKYEGNGEGNKV